LPLHKNSYLRLPLALPKVPTASCACLRYSQTVTFCCCCAHFHMTNPVCAHAGSNSCTQPDALSACLSAHCQLYCSNGMFLPEKTTYLKPGQSHTTRERRAALTETVLKSRFQLVGPGGGGSKKYVA
jgi:hypothetical protein